MPWSRGARLPFPQTRVVMKKGKAVEWEPPCFANFFLYLESHCVLLKEEGDIVGASAASVWREGSVGNSAR